MKRTRRGVLAMLAFGFVLLTATNAPASIQEQRARLPPAAECGTDPVAGVWKSHAYYPRLDEWYVFTLTIRRSAADESRLEGTVHSRFWNGNAAEQEPPECRPGLVYQTVMMPALGSVDPSGHIRFEGQSWQREQVFCGRAGSGYNPDRFRGTIDTSINEFQSVNNDGGALRDVPTVFRRVQCLSDAPISPRVNAQAPEFFPQTSGCGCGLF